MEYNIVVIEDSVGLCYEILKSLYGYAYYLCRDTGGKVNIHFFHVNEKDESAKIIQINHAAKCGFPENAVKLIESFTEVQHHQINSLDSNNEPLSIEEISNLICSKIDQNSVVFLDLFLQSTQKEYVKIARLTRMLAENNEITKVQKFAKEDILSVKLFDEISKINNATIIPWTADPDITTWSDLANCNSMVYDKHEIIFAGGIHRKIAESIKKSISGNIQR